MASELERDKANGIPNRRDTHQDSGIEYNISLLKSEFSEYMVLMQCKDVAKKGATEEIEECRKIKVK